MKILDREKIQILNYHRNLRRIGEIYAAFEKNEISPVLIKGVSAAAYYPKPFQRSFSDIDLAVNPKEFEAARKLIKDNNFNVDLHCGLRHLDTVEWDELFNGSFIEIIENTRIRSLRVEDHLRVLCIHWLNDGGADRTRLWDIYFALTKNPDLFDWNRFFDLVDEKRRFWLLAVLSITEEYLGLNLKNIGSPSEKLELSSRIKAQVEKEWGSDIRLVPLHITIRGGGDLPKQLKKRIPPNLLQAIVETDSDIIDDIYYKLRVRGFIVRTKKSLIHIKSVLRNREF